MEYASKAAGTAGVTLGTIGTSLGAIASMGGLAGLFGITPKNGAGSGDPGDRPVTRYEMELFQQINARDKEIVELKAERYADAKADALEAQINQQAIWSAGVTSAMGYMTQQIQQLFGITKLVVPNGNVAPGWGPAMVGPFPPVPPTPPASATPSGSTTTGG